MNYFAHLHIASLTKTSWAGNLLGDFPVVASQLDDDLYQGWRLHQMVDVMVDEHPASLAFRVMPRLGRRRFAGIVQDIAMDYWLIQYWSKFSDEPLALFCQRAVEGLVKDKRRTPERLMRMIESLEEHNWLANLGQINGVEKAIHSIMRRWRHGHHLQSFVEELPEVIEQAEQPFLLLYPDLLDFVAQQMKKTEVITHMTPAE
ncbi:ACP phosphodiesterase [Marinomonas posidonica]|uniref:Acyl carrier protein phosphodiesterase n=1 Tax=Marinomonas posidonica (strain CECT 7376 / NCIMB 14433 / IVIA-Po-181) TaxID=491952 RepID=F6CTP8_MARPP|nr:ACP phosphodiesterase [Marinomonas posidonica]AEF55163.1 Acyl carrier protein phosphodiesterase [Marinomonas posidonica IVIA-Po-181]